MQLRNVSLISDWLRENEEEIRVFTNTSPGFGNQAASANLIARLRQMGFRGLIEFIYPNRMTGVITELFGLPAEIPSAYFSANDKIFFYTFEAHFARLRNGKLNPVTLSLTGGIDIPKYGKDELYLVDPAMTPDPNFDLERVQFNKSVLFNYANVFNTDVSILFSPYHCTSKYSDMVETNFHLRNQTHPVVQTGSWNKFIVTPTVNISQAEKFLAGDEGKYLLKSSPALETMMSAYENKSINFIPLYGHPLVSDSYFPNCLGEIIAGARYAQLHGAHLNKPLIMPIFYDLKPNTVKTIRSFIDNVGWDEEMQKSLRKFRLRDAFSITLLSDENASEKIKNVKPGEILLVGTGKLPQVVFNALYTHVDSNILLQVREGASSFTNLLQTGRPHLRCGGPWEIDYDNNADPELLGHMRDMEWSICRPWQDWYDENVPEKIGQYIIKAQNPGSALSRYFRALKEAALAPANDRIVAGLQGALEILNKFAEQTPLQAAHISSASASAFNSSVVTGLLTTAVSRFINSTQAISGLLPASASAETDATPSRLSSGKTIDTQTWLTVAAVSVAATACLVVLARRLHLSDKFRYCKNTVARTFWSKPQPNIEDPLEGGLEVGQRSHLLRGASKSV